MKKFPAIICIILIILVLCFLSVYVTERVKNRVKSSVNSIEYDYKEYPLERNNVKLHLDRIEAKGINSGKNILLLHGVTYSSNEFDIDYLITDPIVAEMWCSSCWRYDGEKSPNGGRREICVDKSEKLIDLSELKPPTLIICGDKDPYINYELISSAKTQLPKGSDVQIIKGGSHVVFMEKPYHKDFQEKLIRFLKS